MYPDKNDSNISNMTTLKPGNPAPNFSGKDQDGVLHTLKDYKGGKLILFFYPKANTPGCTAEACNLRDHYRELQEKGYRLLGVSADSAKRQKNFKTKYKFPFPLLADEEKEILQAYGVWGEKKMFGKKYMGIFRTTFIIDEAGIIEKVITKVHTKNHAQQLVDA